MSEYFRRVYRDGDKLRSVHVGSSKDALIQVLQRRHRLKKAYEKAHREECEKLRRWLVTIDDAMDQYGRQLDSLLKVWLRVQRISVCRDGSWQVKRQRKRKKETVPMAMTRDDFDELVVLAERGNEKAEESLRQLMREDRDTWRPFGDLSALVQKQLLSSVTSGATTGTSAVASASLEVGLEELRQRLRRGISDPLRDLAIDQIIMAHIDTHRQGLAVAEPEQSRTMVNHNDQRMKRSQARLQAAVTFLAKVDQILGLKLEPVLKDSAAFQPKGSDHEESLDEEERPTDDPRATDTISQPIPGVVKSVINPPR
jgi:hypothetical protein